MFKSKSVHETSTHTEAKPNVLSPLQKKKSKVGMVGYEPKYVLTSM